MLDHIEAVVDRLFRVRAILHAIAIVRLRANAIHPRDLVPPWWPLCEGSGGIRFIIWIWKLDFKLDLDIPLNRGQRGHGPYRSLDNLESPHHRSPLELPEHVLSWCMLTWNMWMWIMVTDNWTHVTATMSRNTCDFMANVPAVSEQTSNMHDNDNVMSVQNPQRHWHLMVNSRQVSVSMVKTSVRSLAPLQHAQSIKVTWDPSQFRCQPCPKLSVWLSWHAHGKRTQSGTIKSILWSFIVKPAGQCANNSKNYKTKTIKTTQAKP